MVLLGQLESHPLVLKPQLQLETTRDNSRQTLSKTSTMDAIKPQLTFLSLAPIHHTLTISPPSSPVPEARTERSNSELSTSSIQFLRLGHVDKEE